MEKTDRNELCQCGSGKKTEDCNHQPREQKGPIKTKQILQSLVAIVIFIIVVGMFLNISTSGDEAPGDAPEGKVWSPEHNHWHNAD